MSQAPTPMDDPRDDPRWESLTLEEKKRIMQLHVQDMYAAALMDDLDMHDDDEADAEAAACGGGVPASKKAIVELHTPTWDEARRCMSRASMEEDQDGGGCAICLDRLEMGQELRMMPCSHTFHQLCIFKWLVVNRLCPICQFALPSSEEDQDMLDEVEEEEEDDASAEKRYYDLEFIDFMMNF